MSWPIDKSKLERVQQLMVQHDLDALVVRAPDNVLYLTNYWCMKGYDAVVFPRQGEATLIVLEPQLEDAQRNSWTRDLRLFSGYDEDYHISRFFRFSEGAGEKFSINGIPATHVSLDAEIKSIL